MLSRTPQNTATGFLRRPHTWLIAAAFLLVSSGLAASSTAPVQQQSSPAAAPAPVDDSNYPVFMKVCRNCHDAERIVSVRRSRVEWEGILDTMATKGAQGTDEEWETVLHYLLHYYGKVYINRSTAAELVEVLGISDKDAAAIGAYRKDKGDFADFDALAKVPGIDVKMLEQKRDAIAF